MAVTDILLHRCLNPATSDVFHQPQVISSGFLDFIMKGFHKSLLSPFLVENGHLNHLIKQQILGQVVADGDPKTHQGRMGSVIGNP